MPSPGPTKWTPREGVVGDADRPKVPWDVTYAIGAHESQWDRLWDHSGTGVHDLRERLTQRL